MALIAHKERLITGGLLALLFFTAVFVGGYVLQGAILVAVLIGLWEFYSFFWQGRKNIFFKVIGMFLGAFLVFTFAYSGAQSTLAIIVLTFVVSALSFLFHFGFSTNKETISFPSYSILPLGIIGIALPLVYTLSLTWADQLFAVFIAIATDAGGYYAGLTFGKRKIWPRVSPKKSVEGAIGGMCACIVLCLLAGILNTYFTLGLPNIPLWAWPFMGVLLNISAQLGDFFESALKRSVNIKDSGRLLPGHGGLLDRIDSLLFVLPVYYCICLVTKCLTPAIETIPLP